MKRLFTAFAATSRSQLGKSKQTVFTSTKGEFKNNLISFTPLLLAFPVYSVLNQQFLFNDDGDESSETEALPEIVAIPNPFQEIQSFNCFGCSDRNEKSLGLKFFKDMRTNSVFTTYNFDNNLTSFPTVVHGGALLTVCDEVAFFTLFEKYQRAALTLTMNTTFKKVARPNNELKIEGIIIAEKGRTVTVKVSVFNDSNEVLLETDVVYWIGAERAMKQILGDDPAYKKFYTTEMPEPKL